MLKQHGLPSSFNGTPNEIADAVPFAEDTARRDYDRRSADRLARGAGGNAAGVRALPRRLHRQVEPGAFLVGQLRPRRHPLLGPRPLRRIPGGIPGLPDRITREAYSQEVSSAGFWAGGAPRRTPSSTATPIPNRHSYPRRIDRHGRVERRLAGVHPALRRRADAADPEALLTSFLQSTYDAAANLATGTAQRSNGSPSRPSWAGTGKARSSCGSR